MKPVPRLFSATRLGGRVVQRTSRAIDLLHKQLDLIRYGNSYRKRHIILTGFPRSGTTLFYNMLSYSLPHFAVDDWEYSARKTIRSYQNHISKNFVDLFDPTAVFDANVHDKDVIFLLLVRDVRDIVTSVHANVPDDYFIGYEGRYAVRGHYPNYQVEFVPQGIEQFFGAIQSVDSTVPNSLLIRYEDLIAQPEAVQQLLRDTYALNFANNFADYAPDPTRRGMRYVGKWQAVKPELDKSTDKLSRENINRWKSAEHRKRVETQFTRYPQMFSVLTEFGYEQDDSWFYERAVK